MKANYQMLGLAFFTFYQDTINVSLPKKFELKLALTPTNRYFLNLEKSCDIHLVHAKLRYSGFSQ
jgi:hypothetical protein